MCSNLWQYGSRELKNRVESDVHSVTRALFYPKYDSVKISGVGCDSRRKRRNQNVTLLRMRGPDGSRVVSLPDIGQQRFGLFYIDHGETPDFSKERM